MGNRNLILDIYKGILILLVIIGHFLLKWCVGKDTDYRLINGIISVIYSFHMSAFFAASGYSFEKYGKNYSLTEYAKRTFISLFVPYTVFSIFYGGLKLVGSSNALNPIDFSEVILFCIKPLGWLWFIYVLLLFRLISNLMSKDIKGIKIWYIVAVSLFAVYPLLSNIKLFGGGYVAKFYIFFAMGSIYALHSNFLNRYISKLSIPIAVSFFAAENIYVIGCRENLIFSTEITDKAGNSLSVLFFVCSILGILLVLQLSTALSRNESSVSKIIAYEGKNSFIIYLTHQILLSMFRIVAIKFTKQSATIQIIVMLLPTLIFCVAFSEIINRGKYLRKLIYPLR